MTAAAKEYDGEKAIWEENFHNVNLAKIWDSLYRIYNEQKNLSNNNSNVTYEWEVLSRDTASV